METLVFICVLAWAALFYVERAASENAKAGRYAWLAHAGRPLLFFTAIGAFLIIVGTDWENPVWERWVGISCILIGIVLFARRFSRRGVLQAGLESGKLETGE